MSYGDFLGFFALIAGFCFTVIFCVRLLKLHENKPALPGGITAEKATQYATHNAEIENRLREPRAN